MVAVFYISSLLAVGATVMVITRLNAIHALLYLIVSLLSLAMVFYTLGAPFVAALEVIIYAGAIMVLFIFVIMMLNLGKEATRQESQWLKGSMWIGPSFIAIVLLCEWIYMLAATPHQKVGHTIVELKEVGISLYGPYMLGVELASLLLLAGLVAAYHLCRRKIPQTESMENTQ